MYLLLNFFFRGIQHNHYKIRRPRYRYYLFPSSFTCQNNIQILCIRGNMDCQLPAIFIKKSERLTEHQQEKMLTP